MSDTARGSEGAALIRFRGLDRRTERIPAFMSSRTMLTLTVVAVAAAMAAACEGSPTDLSPSPASPPPATALATRPSMDPELEAVLPDRVGELEIEKRSLAGMEFSSNADPTFQQFLQEIGVSGASVSVASGVGGSTETSNTLMLAIRIRGASEDQIMSTFRRILEENQTRPYTVTTQTVSGKDVLLAVAQGAEGPPAYFYARGDVMLFVAASDESIAEEAIALLP
jgi:hypothetical protein